VGKIFIIRNEKRDKEKFYRETRRVRLERELKEWENCLDQDIMYRPFNDENIG